jgi:hypothetical protein
MSKGGKGAIVGYEYYMGVQLVVSYGPVDAVTQIMFGDVDRVAWEGSATGNQSLVIDKPKLFGGEGREGGVVGVVDVMMGGAQQLQNPYLLSTQGPNTPGYRNVLSLVFRGKNLTGSNKLVSDMTEAQATDLGKGSRSFMWSSGNPYFKTVWVRARRILKGWANEAPWYPERAQLPNGLDMNPAHIMYECLTNDAWGMGYTADDMDDAAWRAAADKLYAENFGLSLEWKDTTDIENFIQVICDHINCNLQLDLKTSRFRPKLIRNDYVVSSLPVLDTSNVITLKSFERTSWGETTNEITVKYTDRDENEAVITVHNLANIQAQGAVVSATRDYPGIRDDALAARVAQRDLATASAPLAKVSLTCNRVLYDKAEGDVFVLTWAPHQIERIVMRIVKINKGNLINDEIEIEAIEDIFALPLASYTARPTSKWENPISAPQPATFVKVLEAPYWDVVHYLDPSEQAALTEGYGFAEVIASRPRNGFAINYDISRAQQGVEGGLDVTVATGTFSGRGKLKSAIDSIATTIQLYDLIGKQDIPGTWSSIIYAYIDNEAVAVTSFDLDTGLAVVRRGVIDTVPAEHAADSIFIFAPVVDGQYDPTEHGVNQTAYYRALPKSGIGALPIGQAAQYALTFANRAFRPYPPANIKVNGAYRASLVQSTGLTLSWAHRNRLQQTAQLIDNTQGSITIEPGTTYKLALYNDETNQLLAQSTGGSASTSWSPPATGGSYRFEISSLRDGADSWQKQVLRFAYIAAGVVGWDNSWNFGWGSGKTPPIDVNLVSAFALTRSSILPANGQPSNWYRFIVPSRSGFFDVRKNVGNFFSLQAYSYDGSQFIGSAYLKNVLQASYDPQGSIGESSLLAVLNDNGNAVHVDLFDMSTATDPFLPVRSITPVFASGQPASGVAIAQGAVFVIDKTGTAIQMYSGATGALLRTMAITTNPDVIQQIDAFGSQVLYLNENGQIVVRGGADWLVLRTIDTGLKIGRPHFVNGQIMVVTTEAPVRLLRYSTSGVLLGTHPIPSAIPPNAQITVQQFGDYLSVGNDPATVLDASNGYSAIGDINSPTKKSAVVTVQQQSSPTQAEIDFVRFDSVTPGTVLRAVIDGRTFRYDVTAGQTPAQALAALVARVNGNIQEFNPNIQSTRFLRLNDGSITLFEGAVPLKVGSQNRVLTSTDNGATYTVSKAFNARLAYVYGVNYWDGVVGTKRISIGRNDYAQIQGVIVQDGAGAPVEYTGYPRVDGNLLATYALYASDAFYLVGRLMTTPTDAATDNTMYLYSSADGLNYTLIGPMTQIANDPNKLADGAYGSFSRYWFNGASLRKIGSRWFLQGDRALYYTDNAQPLTGWTRANLHQHDGENNPPPSYFPMLAVGSTLVIFGQSTSESVSWSTNNGTTWTSSRPATMPFAVQFGPVAGGLGQVIGYLQNAGTLRALVASVTDMNTWTLRTVSGVVDLRDVQVMGTGFVGIDNATGAVVKSTNGYTWTAATEPWLTDFPETNLVSASAESLDDALQLKLTGPVNYDFTATGTSS